jgi:hypothetical protein
MSEIHVKVHEKGKVWMHEKGGQCKEVSRLLVSKNNTTMIT